MFFFFLLKTQKNENPNRALGQNPVSVKIHVIDFLFFCVSEYSFPSCDVWKKE